SVLDTVGSFDEALASWEDADLWLRIAKRFDFAYTMSALAFYRLHAGNITNRRLEWYEYQLRVRARHLDDIRDVATYNFAMAEIRSNQVLLQEQLLRERRRGEHVAQLLNRDYGGHSTRYRLGRLAMQGPAWLGASYAAGIRTLGNAKRKAHVDTENRHT